MPRDFFVSYNRADRTWAEWIAWHLEAAGYTTVLQAWDFRPGANFALQMQEASAETERTVAVLSPDYLASGFAASEWAEAFADDPTGERGLLVPVRVRECVPQGVLGQVVYVDLVGLDPAAARDVLLEGVKRGRAKPPSAPNFPGAPGSPPSGPPRFPGGGGDTAPSRAVPLVRPHDPVLVEPPSPGVGATDATTRQVIGPDDGQPPSGAAIHRVLLPEPPPTEEPGAPTHGRSAWSVLLSFWSAIPSLLKALAAVLTVAVALLIAVVAVRVIGSPDPGPTAVPTSRAAAAPPSQLAGRLSEVAVADRALPLGDFCARRNLPCTGYDAAQLRRPGNVVGYTIEAVGYRDQRLSIRWSLYDAETNARVPEPALTDQAGWPDGNYTPAAERDQNSGELWVPFPPRSGRFFVRLELHPPAGARLDWEDTEPFSVS